MRTFTRYSQEGVIYSYAHVTHANATQLASLTQYMAKWGSWEQIHFTGLVLKSNTSFLLMRAVGSLLLGSAAVLLRAAYLNDVKFRTYVFIGQCVSGAAFALASSIPSSYGTVIPVPLLSSMILIPTLLLVSGKIIPGNAKCACACMHVCMCTRITQFSFVPLSRTRIRTRRAMRPTRR